MKLAQILKGKRAEKTIEMEVVRGAGPTKIVLRPLHAEEEIAVVADAIKAAKARGVAEPRDGHPIYDAELWAHTLALGCFDPDSPENAREHFFANAAEVTRDLDTDTVAILHEHHQLWQEECSPSRRATSFAQLLDLTRDIASENGADFFVRLSPLTRLSWARTLAAQHVSSQERTSPSTSSSVNAG